MLSSTLSLSLSLKDGLRNLFSRAGKVLRVHVMPQKNQSRSTTFGYVGMLNKLVHCYGLRLFGYL